MRLESMFFLGFVRGLAFLRSVEIMYVIWKVLG